MIHVLVKEDFVNSFNILVFCFYFREFVEEAGKASLRLNEYLHVR